MLSFSSDLPASTSLHSVLSVRIYLSPVPEKLNSKLCLNDQHSNILSQLKLMTYFMDRESKEHWSKSTITRPLSSNAYPSILLSKIFTCCTLSIYLIFMNFLHSIRKWRSFRTWFPWCPCCRCLRCFCWVTVSQQITKPINRRTKR